MTIALGALAIGFVELTASTKENTSIGERIEWVAPPGCVVEEELEKKVVAQLHQAPETLLRRVVGTAQAIDPGYLVVFEVWEGARLIGKRKLELPGTECANHTETLSFVLTLLLEGGKVDEPEVQPDPLPREPLPDAEAAKDSGTNEPTKKTSPPRTPTRELLFTANVGANSTPLLLPEFGVSLGGGVGIIAFSHYSFELFGGFRLPEERLTTLGEGVRLGGGGGRLEACYLFHPGDFRLGPCAAFSVEMKTAEGFGFSENKREIVTESFPFALARLEWLLRADTFVRGTFGMGASFTPRDFVNQSGRVLFSEASVFPFLGISVGATLDP